MFGRRTPMLLAGLAAFAYYKYSQMSPEEKTKLVGKLKEKGKKLVDQLLPPEIKDQFTPQEDTRINQFESGNEYIGSR